MYRKKLNPLVSFVLTWGLRSYYRSLTDWQNQKKEGYVMKTIVRLMLVFILMIASAPAYAAEARQMWKCQMNEEVSEEEVQAMLGEWLKAARTMKGGERLELYAFFPVAVNDIGEYDLWVVLHAPSFVEWGQFWDNYKDSPADEVESRTDEKFTCPDSALWESIKIK